MPLFGVLGYEFSLVTAGFASVSSLDLGAARARAAQGAAAQPALPRYAFIGAVAASSLLAVLVASVPAAIAAVHGIWTPTCDWSFGLYSLAIMPLTSAALGGATGYALGIAAGVRAAPRHWWIPHRSTWLAVAFPVVGLAVLGLWRFYSEPPVFIYNPLIGYFPGNMYDEDIALGAPAVWSRLESIAVVVTIAAAVASQLDTATRRMRWKPGTTRRTWCARAVAVAAAGAAIALRSQAGALGYAVDAVDIQVQLGGRLDTPHFTIFYADTPEIRSEIELIGRDHELRYHQVADQIQSGPAGKLTSYYFASPQQKARWFGAKRVEMAKPWRREIYLDHRPFPHPSLRHEIAHVVAGAFGDRVFGVAAKHGVLFNPGLIEGLAVALDWPGGTDGLTPHQAVRAMQILGVEPQITELFSIEFLTASAARGYTTAGSFLRFLLERHGAGPMRSLYASGGDFERAYRRSLASLEREWRAMVSGIELPSDLVQGVRERFRSGSVFSRPCPHAVAAKRNAAAAELAAGRISSAAAWMRQVCNDAPNEPRHLLELGDILDEGSAVERSQARGIWSIVADDRNNTSSLRAEALKRLARSEPDRSAAIAQMERALALPLDPSDRRTLDAEAYALRANGPAGPELREYFQPGRTTEQRAAAAAKAVALEPTTSMPHYLLGLQKAIAGDWRTAAAELDHALAIGLPSDNFVRFAARRLAIAAHRTSDTARLDRAISALLSPNASEADRLLAEDWKQRRAFENTLTGALHFR